MDKPYIQKLTLSRPGLAIFLVDGPWVRTNHNVDFIMGGHDLVYNFIPKGQIWIDDSIEVGERPLTLLHELYERHRMATKKETYDVAHDFAKAFESKYRKDPTGLHEKIQELIDMNCEMTEKKAFTLPTDLVFEYGLLPGAMALGGAGWGAYEADKGDKLRGALETGAMMGIGGLGAGAARHFGRLALPGGGWRELARPVITGAGIVAGGTVGRSLFPGRTKQLRAKHDQRAEQRDKTAAYQLGFTLAFKCAGFKEEPTRLTHKNPGPVPTDPTSVIESTPKQDTCVVSPKTY